MPAVAPTAGTEPPARSLLIREKVRALSRASRMDWARGLLNKEPYARIVQQRLGHANVSITLDTYSHVDLDMQAAAARQVAALVAAAPPSAP